MYIALRFQRKEVCLFQNHQPQRILTTRRPCLFPSCFMTLSDPASFRQITLYLGGVIPPWMITVIMVRIYPASGIMVGHTDIDTETRYKVGIYRTKSLKNCPKIEVHFLFHCEQSWRSRKVQSSDGIVRAPVVMGTRNMERCLPVCRPARHDV